MILWAPCTVAFPKKPVVWGAGWSVLTHGEEPACLTLAREQKTDIPKAVRALWLMERLLLCPEGKQPAQSTCPQARRKNKGIFTAYHYMINWGIWDSEVAKLYPGGLAGKWCKWGFMPGESFNFKSVAPSTLTATSYPRFTGRERSHQSSDFLRSKLQPAVSYWLHSRATAILVRTDTIPSFPERIPQVFYAALNALHGVPAFLHPKLFQYFFSTAGLLVTSVYVLELAIKVGSWLPRLCPSLGVHLQMLWEWPRPFKT